MRTRTGVPALIAAAALVSVVASCNRGESPTGPGGSSVITTRLQPVVPSEIPTGESVQLRVTATKSDGSLEDVSTTARWAPVDSAVVQLTATGLATGKAPGEQTVAVTFGGRGASAQLLVLPRGTFRLSGIVREGGTGIENVVVTVTAGVGSGLTAISDALGQFVLYGVSGSVQVQLQRPGYLRVVQFVDVTAHGTKDFTIQPEQTRKDYAGTYTLTISAASPCSANPGIFPDEARRRVYTADVTQTQRGGLTVRLRDADFIVTYTNGNSFLGFVDPAGPITFEIGYKDLYYGLSIFELVERFGSTALVIDGLVTATATSDGISGTLNGEILIASQARDPFLPALARCASSTHGFLMVRR